MQIYYFSIGFVLCLPRLELILHVKFYLILLTQNQENFEKKKAMYGEKMKNKMAISHRTAEEMRATVVADYEHAVFTVEEVSATFRATGRVPKKLFACFGC